jgi:ribosomal protein S18 acetylase RimI-like enzyme
MSAQAPSLTASPAAVASTAAGAGVYVCRADYANPHHAQVLVALLDAYAQDPMGGGEPLSDFAKQNLIACLAARPQAFSVLAFEAADEKTPIGLVNCIEGFSTFACKPLVNVHDVVVLPAYRGQRVAERMFALVHAIAKERGACKLTLEVLSGNLGALRLYTRLGFAQYQLDPAAGTAQFLQKWLD